jgi:hypothetical protein
MLRLNFLVSVAALFIGSLLSVRASTNERQGALKVSFIDEDSRQPVNARVYLTDSSDQVFITDHTIPFDVPWMKDMIGHTGRHFNTLDNGFSIRLSAGIYRLHIEKGVEYLPLDTNVVLEAGETLELTLSLKRWIDLNRLGWYSADTHNHRDPGEIRSLMVSDNLNFAVFQSNWNESPQPAQQGGLLLPSADQQGCFTVDRDHLLFLASHEFETSFGAMFFHLADKTLFPLHDLSDARLENYLALGRKTKQLGGWVELDKPIYKYAHLYVLNDLVDFVGLANNHNLHNKYLPEGSNNLNRSILGDYPGDQRGYSLFCFDLYYHYLNLGKRLMPTAGSASFPIANPFGFNRVFVKLDGKPNVEGFFKAMQAGQSFVSNGPLLFCTIDNTERGETVQTQLPTVELKMEIYSPIKIDCVEVIQNGSVVWSTTEVSMENHRSVLSQSIEVHKSGWIAVRAFARGDGDNLRFAHTAPIFIRYRDEPFRPELKSIEAIELLNAALKYQVTYSASPDRARQLEVIEDAERKLTALKEMALLTGGEGGIRTPGTVAGSAVFKTAAIDHSATSPVEN